MLAKEIAAFSQKMIGQIAMASPERAGIMARDTILKLLSDDEIAKVSMAEAASALEEGQEYLDLDHLDQGVQTVTATSNIVMGNILPRSGVRAETWRTIVSQFAG